MGQLLEIIIFAVLAAYFLMRLWSVLGKNTPEDEERQRNKAKLSEDLDNVVPMPGRKAPPQTVQDVEDENDVLPAGIREGVRQIVLRDPDFDLKEFLQGAKIAHEMILTAFAKGDLETLENLLEPEMFKAFSKTIKAREKKEQSMETTVEKVERIEADSIRVDGDEAKITVRIRSRQIIVIYDKDGVIIDNEAKISNLMTDVWVFKKFLAKEEPNWYLESTHG